jgi:hypothetical protein
MHNYALVLQLCCRPSVVYVVRVPNAASPITTPALEYCCKVLDCKRRDAHLILWSCASFHAALLLEVLDTPFIYGCRQPQFLKVKVGDDVIVKRRRSHLGGCFKGLVQSSCLHVATEPQHNRWVAIV